jgi:aspartate carbamoyltransferase catalytic subunit
MRHMVDFEDMTISEWQELYALCRDIMRRPDDYRDALRGRTLASLFFEPSTRTSFSFQAAMLKLGGGVFGFADPVFSSVSKGEKLKDTIAMCSSYADAIVIRTPWEGSAKAAALYSDCPVINAGDGGHLHPTQTLTDLTTIMEVRGEISGLNIGFCGDLRHGRTVHSLIKALGRFRDISFFLVSPRSLSIPTYLRTYLKEKKLSYIETTNLESTMPQLDVLYMTRVQRERFTDPNEYERLKNVYILTPQKLKLARSDLIVMHPLPRADEIQLDVDGDPRAMYYRQAGYGLYIRMALLMSLISEGKTKAKYIPPEREPHLCKNANCISRTNPYVPILVKSEFGKNYCAYCDREIRRKVDPGHYA